MSEPAKPRCQNCGALVERPSPESHESGACLHCGVKLVPGSSLPGEQSGTRDDVFDRTIDLHPQGEDLATSPPTLDLRSAKTSQRSNLTGTPRKRRPENIGRFQVRQNLGQGGFGVVYRAYDPVLDREVALKVPRLISDDEHELERFVREAQAAARLRHPNIVAVFESGRADGEYYIAAEFVEGEPLSQRIDKGLPVIQQSVSWVEKLAGALGYAHDEGVVHRDIKPANIMIDTTGRPQIMDFGLAKRRGDNDDVTMHGSVIGTPAYMSPEQARGELQQTGPLSDQYSLGAVLYHLLTGQKPYSGRAQSIVLHVSDVNREPPRPRAVNPLIPKDLEACCLKAMEKEPSRRYATAYEFAADLQRWLSGMPVHARPITSAERCWRWSKRNRALANLLALFLLLLLMFASSATVAAFWFRHLAERERIAAENADDARQQETAARRDAENTLSDMYSHSGLVAAESGDAAQAVLWFANAVRQAHNDSERQYANRIRLRNWSREVPMPVAALDHAGHRVRQLDFHVSGRYLLTRSDKPEFRIWDVTTEKMHVLTDEIQKACAVTWSPDGRWLAAGRDQGVELISFPDGQQRTAIPCDSPASTLAFSRDGNFLAIGANSAQVWNCETRQFSSQKFAHPRSVTKVVFNAKGDRIVTACQDRKVRLFAVDSHDSSEPLFPALPSSGPIVDQENPLAPLLIDNDRGLLTVTGEREITWWDTTSGEPIRTLTAKRGIVNVIRSPDGQQFVLCDFDHAHLWHVAFAGTIGAPMAHKNFIYSAAFNPKGGALLTVGADRKVGHWASDSGKPLTPAVYHQGEVWMVTYAPDGNHFATAQEDGLVRVWRLLRDDSHVRKIEIEGSESFIRLSQDGKFVTPSGWNFSPTLTSVRLYEVTTSTPEKTVVKPQGRISQVIFSPDTSRLMTLSILPAAAGQADASTPPFSQPGRIEFWDRQTGHPAFDPIDTPSEPLGAAWSPNGERVVVICGHGQIIVIDAETGEVLHRFDHGGRALPRFMVREWIRFTPDGKCFVSWGMDDNLVRCWNADTAALRFTVAHARLCHDVLFSPDGQHMATTSMDNTVGVWNADNGEVLNRLEHPDWVFTAAFSRDGANLFTACRDGMARLWDWRRGELACAELKHQDEVFGVAFAHDDCTLLTGCRNGTIQIWNRHDGRPVARSLVLPGQVYEVAVTPDGNSAICAGTLPAIYVLRLNDLIAPIALELDSDSLPALAELISGQRVHDSSVKNLTSREWLERWLSLRRQQFDFDAILR